MEAPWAKDVGEVEKGLQVSVAKGLSSAEAKKRLAEYGPNELPKEEGRSFFALVLEQFDDPLVKILLLAAVISAAIAVSEVYEDGGAITADKFAEPMVILLILVLNAIVGVYQESNAEKSLEALKEMQPDTARTLRDGEWVTELASEDLVPGDVVELRVGDKVPADCRLAVLKTTTLRAEQMTLTGESVSVEKIEDAKANVDCDIQGKLNMLFSGTALANGHGLAIVTSTGMRTEIGKIQEQLEQAAAERAEEKTPLKEKIEEFSDMLQWIISGICLLVWVINFRMFVDLETMTVDFKKCIYYFQIAVALAVAAIPEGLPTVITMCLALGTRKMAARNSIVRKLPAVETLGCTSVICSDKTGTLTTNQMSVREVVVVGASEQDLVMLDVAGSTYDPFAGAVSEAPGSEGKAHAKGGKNLAKLAQICAVCNESTIDRVPGKGFFKHVGAPTESALTVLVEKLMRFIGGEAEVASTENTETENTETETESETANADYLKHNKAVSADAPKVATLEFTRDRKSMSVIVKTGKTRNSANQLLVKGAPETLLERCTHVLTSDGSRVALTPAGREVLKGAISELADKALRCLGMAYSESLGALADYDGSHSHPAFKQLRDPTKFVDVEQGLTFVGFVAMQDPPRPEVKESMEACRQAGIRVIVITGDNKLTAEAICREIGIFDADEDVTTKSFIGLEFSKLPAAKQQALLRQNSHCGMVFSRAEPKFKQDIVRLLKQDGHVVAMTGDGVNDAPALKMADIGIAMGITGTEVAKESSDMVLADDNFSTIVASVQEGRAIYNNMRAFIRYMISSNIGEVMSIFFVAALGLPEGMTPIQLLWVNLVTDGPPATALGLNPSDPDIMQKPPRERDERLISSWTLFRYMVVGLYVGFATVGSFTSWFMHGAGSEPFLGFLDLGKDGHTSVSAHQLMNWAHCNVTTNTFAIPGEKPYDFSAAAWTAGDQAYQVSGCDYFGDLGKMKASTISLSVLVTIEMLNALNAISENGSLLAPGTHPFVNIWLLLAMGLSFGLHFMILYVPALCPMFDVVPLSTEEWLLVVLYSLPVLLIDEVLKLVGRAHNAQDRRRRAQQVLEAKKQR